VYWKSFKLDKTPEAVCWFDWRFLLFSVIFCQKEMTIMFYKHFAIVEPLSMSGGSAWMGTCMIVISNHAWGMAMVAIAIELSRSSAGKNGCDAIIPESFRRAKEAFGGTEAVVVHSAKCGDE
jgi:hypothetical protein